MQAFQPSAPPLDAGPSLGRSMGSDGETLRGALLPLSDEAGPYSDQPSLYPRIEQHGDEYQITYMLDEGVCASRCPAVAARTGGLTRLVQLCAVARWTWRTTCRTASP
jgi:hypothetical protein